MDPEITYIRSSTMQEPQPENSRKRLFEKFNFEWLKTAIFLSILFIVSFVAIRFVGPLLFSDYVPAILGLTAEDAEENVDSIDGDGAVIAPRDDSEVDQGAILEPADSGKAAEDAVDAEVDEPIESAGDDGSTAVEVDETTTGKVEPTAQNNFELYAVRANDTLTSIAATYGVSVEEIIAANELLNPHYLQLGQEIRIPQND